VTRFPFSLQPFNPSPLQPALLARSSGYEINELPTPSHPTNPRSITGIIQCWIGPLRRCDPDAVLFGKSLRQNSVELRPQSVVVPILENPVSLSVLRFIRPQNKQEIF